MLDVVTFKEANGSLSHVVRPYTAVWRVAALPERWERFPSLGRGRRNERSPCRRSFRRHVGTQCLLPGDGRGAAYNIGAAREESG